jgi:hypothetical protein
MLGAHIPCTLTKVAWNRCALQTHQSQAWNRCTLHPHKWRAWNRCTLHPHKWRVWNRCTLHPHKWQAWNICTLHPHKWRAWNRCTLHPHKWRAWKRCTLHPHKWRAWNRGPCGRIPVPWHSESRETWSRQPRSPPKCKDDIYLHLFFHYEFQFLPLIWHFLQNLSLFTFNWKSNQNCTSFYNAFRYMCTFSSSKMYKIHLFSHVA